MRANNSGSLPAAASQARVICGASDAVTASPAKVLAFPVSGVASGMEALLQAQELMKGVRDH